ncbi:MAG: hypothetical protein COX07_08870 [Bacteroidetes bacterium CG23_combo_of_CG06-09_8_20_14_all_32_9]|nr:MAG: hypothetical protein COX07_08870 [Bacteroidetes bacterium CG23_combo_of_CG06-09_8_20_14_all_32_9]
MSKIINKIVIYVKGIVSFMLFFFISIYMTIFVLLPVPILNPKTKRFYTNNFWWYARFLTKAHFNINIQNINPFNEDFTRPAIIVCNHQTLFDVPLTMGMFPRLFVISNNWHHYSPIRLIVERYVDFLPVTNGIKWVLTQSESRIKQGSLGLFFPEGNRTNEPAILRYHKGAFLLAAMLKADILPVVIYASEGIRKKKWYFFKTGKIQVYIGNRIPPVNPDENDEVKTQAKLVCNLSRKIYNKLQNNSTT